MVWSLATVMDAAPNATEAPGTRQDSNLHVDETSVTRAELAHDLATESSADPMPSPDSPKQPQHSTPGVSIEHPGIAPSKPLSQEDEHVKVSSSPGAPPTRPAKSQRDLEQGSSSDGVDSDSDETLCVGENFDLQKTARKAIRL